MSRTLRPLIGALGASLILHLLPFVDAWQTAPVSPPEETPPLQARLIPSPFQAASPEFLLPEPETMKGASIDKPIPRAQSATKEIRKTWTQAIGEQFSAQQREGLFYPEEAIQQGLEGEALVLLLLNEQGQVVAARIEESSGHAMLDDAALRAVRRLRTLPADAPMESLLPVRFRIM